VARSPLPRSSTSRRAARPGSRTGDCDGAFWLANERFAITGTSAGGDTTGARYAFVRVFDLNAGTVVEYQTAPAESLAFKAFRAARDSAWTAYFRTRLP